MQEHDSKNVLPSPPITVLYIISSHFQRLIYIQEFPFALGNLRPWILYVKERIPWAFLVH